MLRRILAPCQVLVKYVQGIIIIVIIIIISKVKFSGLAPAEEVEVRT